MAFKTIILFILLVFLPFRVLADVVSILLPHEIVVERREIFLGDVAFISGGDALLREKIQNISLGASPLPGNPRLLTRQSLLLRLEREGIDSSLIHVEAPDRMEVISQFPLLRESYLEEFLTGILEGDLLALEMGYLEIKYLQGASNIYIPEGELQLHLTRELGDKGRYLGQTTIPMEIFVDGERWRQIYPRFSVEIMSYVPVLTKALKRNDIITSNLVEFKLMGLSKLPADTLFHEEDLLGMRLRRNLEKGDFLRSSFLEEVPLVERGDKVKIILILGSIRLSLIGEARGTGVFGDTIVVRNLDSNNLLNCQIIGPGLVQIEIGGI